MENATLNQPITPPPGRDGYFEITFREEVGAPGVPYSKTDKICLCAKGFQAAKKTFEELGLGELVHIKEISAEAFLAWLQWYAANRYPGKMKDGGQA